MSAGSGVEPAELQEPVEDPHSRQATESRPLCKCHGLPMHSWGVRRGRRRWMCPIYNKDRVRKQYSDGASNYHRDPHGHNYRRVINARRRRILSKRERIQQLEVELGAQEDQS